MRINQVLHSKRIINALLSQETHGIKWLFDFFLLESIAYQEHGKISKKLKILLRNNLTTEDKKILLKNFTFSKPWKLNSGWQVCRHIMFEDFEKDKEFIELYSYNNEIPDHCSLNTCYCGDWIDRKLNNLDKYFDELVNKFVEIRTAIVHKSFPVMVLPSYKGKETAGSFQSSIIDAYPVGKRDLFRTYECFLDPDIFFNITSKCIGSYLKKKYL